MSTRRTATRLAVLAALTLSLAALPPTPRAWADFGADLGGAQFSQRLTTDLVQRRAQVRALQCEELHRAAQQPHGQAYGHPPGHRPPPAVDWNRLPLSPPVGTGWPVSCEACGWLGMY